MGDFFFNKLKNLQLKKFEDENVYKKNISRRIY